MYNGEQTVSALRSRRALGEANPEYGCVTALIWPPYFNEVRLILQGALGTEC
jgi:hypothetical protein